jgi:hypothetical protein
MAELRRRRLVEVILVDALITIAAGSFLYWHDWHLFATFGDWVDSMFGPGRRWARSSRFR